MNKEDFSKKVSIIKDLIIKGDIFQANLSACCSTTLPTKMTTLETYLKLRFSCPAPFSGLIIGTNEAKNEAIMSASPERFMKVVGLSKITFSFSIFLIDKEEFFFLRKFVIVVYQKDLQ